MSENIIRPEEYDILIGGLRKYHVRDIGSNEWIEAHENLLKLNQQAVLEVSSFREELVKELLVMGEKLGILVHETFCILVWRVKVLPKILEIIPSSNTTFVLYTVLYHEATAVNLLEVVLFHENGCASLGESALDLVDYCAQAVVQLIGLVNIGHFRELIKANANETVTEELERQKRDLLYAIGMRCLTILSYLADKINVLPLSVARRMVQTHDVPCLLSEILHCQPWKRNIHRVEKFIDEKWTPVNGSDVLKVTKTEAQAWFCLRQLLFNQDVRKHYEINEFRQRELSKCQALLGVHVIDQLPPLAELKHHLCTLALTGNRDKDHSIFFEEMPQIKDAIIGDAKKLGFKKIAQKQVTDYLDLKHERIVEMARRLNSAYNTDFLVRMEGDDLDTKATSDTPHPISLCGECNASATKKCSKCQKVYYCSRDCQVKHWPMHKENCLEQI